MTDRELLELAAKAAGESVPPRFYPDGSAVFLSGQRWTPLTDDGDALRLAVKLEMLVHIETCYYTSVWNEKANFTEHIGNDGKGCIYAATRLAIVRAAAEIGKAMP